MTVRFVVRGAFRDNGRFVADIGYGTYFAQVIAERTAGRYQFSVQPSPGVKAQPVAVDGTFTERTITVNAPARALGLGSLERVRAYFWSQPTGRRWHGQNIRYWMEDTSTRFNGGDVDFAPQSDYAWFCTTNRRPRPKYGPCIWPTAGH